MLRPQYHQSKTGDCKYQISAIRWVASTIAPKFLKLVHQSTGIHLEGEQIGEMMEMRNVIRCLNRHLGPRSLAAAKHEPKTQKSQTNQSVLEGIGTIP